MIFGLENQNFTEIHCIIGQFLQLIAGKYIQGFDDSTCLLAGVESRTSSPVRIHRDLQCESSIAGLYPCGEGAGYAGGITSAAMDGLAVAEAIAKKYIP